MTRTDGAIPRTHSEARADHVRPLEAPPTFAPQSGPRPPADRPGHAPEPRREPPPRARPTTGRRRAAATVAVLALLALGATLLVPRLLASEPPSPQASAADQHENGHLPDDALVTITGGYRLVRPAAEAFARLDAAAAEAGITLQVNSAYRTYDEQVAMVDEYGLLSEGGRAAEPGTSEHGWGTAVDLTLTGDQLTWFFAHAGEYGFAATIADEPWHWNYIGD